MKDIAIIGAGGMARVRARAFLATGKARICAIASRHLATARALGAELGCTACFDDYRQLAAARPDAVLVEVSHAAQDEIVLWALEQKLHVLIGSVLATNVRNAERILALSKQHRLVVEAGCEARYSAPWVAAKALLDGGELGALVAVRSLVLWGGDPATWYYRQADSHGMPLTHMTYGFVNPVRWLAGDPSAVSAISNRKLHTAPGLVTEETCVANLLLPNDVLYSLTAGFVKPAANLPAWNATLIGTQAAVELDLRENGVGRLIVYRGEQTDCREFPGAADPFVEQAAAFLGGIDGGSGCRNTPAATLGDIRVAEAVVTSIREARTVKL
jgi:predicted dehydrogenase